MAQEANLMMDEARRLLGRKDFVAARDYANRAVNWATIQRQPKLLQKAQKLLEEIQEGEAKC